MFEFISAGWKLVTGFLEQKYHEAVESLIGPIIRSITRIVIGLMLLVVSIGANQNSFLVTAIFAVYGSIFFCVFFVWGRAISKSILDTITLIPDLYSTSLTSAYVFMIFGVLGIQEVLFGVVSGKSFAVYWVTLTTRNDWDLEFLTRVMQFVGAALVVVNKKTFCNFILSWLVGFSAILGIECIMDGGYCNRVLCKALDPKYCQEKSNEKILMVQLAIPLLAYLIAASKS